MLLDDDREEREALRVGEALQMAESVKAAVCMQQPSVMMADGCCMPGSGMTLRMTTPATVGHGERRGSRAKRLGVPGLSQGLCGAKVTKPRSASRRVKALYAS